MDMTVVGEQRTERRKLGDAAEEAAVGFFERERYRVVERNVLYRCGELDLVVEKDDTLAFVEVRMRSTGFFGQPSETVTRAKQLRVVKAAMLYLQKNHVRNRAIRFDVVSVVGRGKDAAVEHIPNAFDAGFVPI